MDKNKIKVTDHGTRNIQVVEGYLEFEAEGLDDIVCLDVFEITSTNDLTVKMLFNFNLQSEMHKIKVLEMFDYKLLDNQIEGEYELTDSELIQELYIEYQK